MFSYRHAFHAGNHADVLKHAVLIHVLKYLLQKEVGLYVIDTHAGAGWYRLDAEFAQKSGEAEDGVRKLWAARNKFGTSFSGAGLIDDYLDLLKALNPEGGVNLYPGSPWICQYLLRQQDRLRLYELHPTEQKILIDNVRQLRAGRQVMVQAVDGFEGLKAQLPPPTRRGLVLIDPSYEIKTDYLRVVEALADSLKRFATGTYMVWYPILAKSLATPDSQRLPDQLRRLADAQKKTWLQATLAVRSNHGEQRGLTASGLFLINPPFTLEAALQDALPELVRIVGQDTGQDAGQHFTLTTQSDR